MAFFIFNAISIIIFITISIFTVLISLSLFPSLFICIFPSLTFQKQITIFKFFLSSLKLILLFFQHTFHIFINTPIANLLRYYMIMIMIMMSYIYFVCFFFLSLLIYFVIFIFYSLYYLFLISSFLLLVACLISTSIFITIFIIFHLTYCYYYL